MKHFFFNGNENLTPEEIKNILISNCEGVEERSYTKRLSEEELRDKSQEYVDTNAAISDENDKLQAAKDNHKEATRPLLAESKQLLRTLKSKHAEVTGKVYRVPNHETGMMEYVNEEGDIIESRRLKPEEKQSRMFVMDRAVNQ